MSVQNPDENQEKTQDENYHLDFGPFPIQGRYYTKKTGEVKWTINSQEELKAFICEYQANKS